MVGPRHVITLIKLHLNGDLTRIELGHIAHADPLKWKGNRDGTQPAKYQQGSQSILQRPAERDAVAANDALDQMEP